MGITVVLGAGGARGVAHIGVLLALEELHIPVRAVVGSSIGALVGGLFATGWSAREISDRLPSLIRRWRARVFAPKPWGAGLVGDRGIRALLHHLFATSALEDLYLPLLVTATDLHSGDPVVFDEGPVWQAVRASLAMPTIFTPYRTPARRWLTDGALSDPVPVGLARSRFPWPVVAVRAQIRPERRVLSDSLLRRPLAWFQVGRMANELSVWRLSEYHLRDHPPDLLLDPVTEDFGCFGYSRSLPLIESARAYTLRHADELLTLAQVIETSAKPTPNSS